MISATNIELSELKKRVDADFYDRISTLQLRVPALRELHEDLPWLWESTLRTAVQRSGAPIQELPIDEKHHELIVNRLRECPLDGNLRDLFRVANKLIAALCVQENEVSQDEAIGSAFGRELEDHSDVAREVAKAFCNGSTLDHLLPRGTRLATTDIEIKLRSFIATELRRIARLRGLEAEAICDVSERTLRTWANIDQTARKISAQRKIAADDLS